MNNNPFSCSGEILRLSFIITTLILLVPGVFLSALGNGMADREPAFAFVVGLISIVVVVLPFLFACAKRLRNIGKNPYMCLLALIPLMPIILWFYLAIKAPANFNFSE